MLKNRGEFSSSLAFVLAASGSAVGLGNIWGFPTNAASHGGAAFLLMYLLLAFLLAYPALMAELVIGRHTRANMFSALQSIARGPMTRVGGMLIGAYGVIVVSLILSFYSLVAGWILAHLFGTGASLIGSDGLEQWFATGSIARDLTVAGIFSLFTIVIVSRGVADGIERWSSRLMPALIVLMLLLITYVLFQPGAIDGLKLYLLPDFSQLLHPSLLVGAMGQAFFSLSLGVGAILIYGSYMRSDDNLPAIGAAVTLLDTSVAFLAGLLIIPALFVAQHYGTTIYSGGDLIAGPDLIFQVLPALFTSMGSSGPIVALAFFLLMAIAALTSSISMLEGPVALAVETSPLQRKGATWLIGAGIFVLTTLIIFNTDTLFGLIVTLTTEYSQPLLGLCLCLYAGWVINRNSLLAELRSGNPTLESSLFWKIWPFYVRYICPLLIAVVLLQQFF